MGDAVADLVQCGDCEKYVKGKNGLKNHRCLKAARLSAEANAQAPRAGADEPLDVGPAFGNESSAAFDSAEEEHAEDDLVDVTLPAAALGKGAERGSLSGDESDSDGDEMELGSRDDDSDADADFDLPDAARDDDAEEAGLFHDDPFLDGLLNCYDRDLAQAAATVRRSAASEIAKKSAFALRLYRLCLAHNVSGKCFDGVMTLVKDSVADGSLSSAASQKNGFPTFKSIRKTTGEIAGLMGAAPFQKIVIPVVHPELPVASANVGVYVSDLRANVVSLVTNPSIGTSSTFNFDPESRSSDAEFGPVWDAAAVRCPSRWAIEASKRDPRVQELKRSFELNGQQLHIVPVPLLYAVDDTQVGRSENSSQLPIYMQIANFSRNVLASPASMATFAYIERIHLPKASGSKAKYQASAALRVLAQEVQQRALRTALFDPLLQWEQQGALILEAKLLPWAALDWKTRGDHVLFVPFIVGMPGDHMGHAELAHMKTNACTCCTVPHDKLCTIGTPYPVRNFGRLRTLIEALQRLSSRDDTGALLPLSPVQSAEKKRVESELDESGHRISVPAWAALLPLAPPLELMPPMPAANTPLSRVIAMHAQFPPAPVPAAPAAAPAAGAAGAAAVPPPPPPRMSPYAGFLVMLMGIFCALPLDPMHLLHLGLAKYMIKFIACFVHDFHGGGKPSREALSRLDTRVSRIASFSDGFTYSRAYSTGFTGMKQFTANGIEHLLPLLYAAIGCDSLIIPDRGVRDLILEVIACSMLVLQYTRGSSGGVDWYRSLCAACVRLKKLMHAAFTAGDYSKSGWNFIKWHKIEHLADMMLAWGMPENSSTSLGEQKHKEAKDDYSATNHRNAIEQMGKRVVEKLLINRYLHSLLDEHSILHPAAAPPAPDMAFLYGRRGPMSHSSGAQTPQLLTEISAAWKDSMIAWFGLETAADIGAFQPARATVFNGYRLRRAAVVSVTDTVVHPGDSYEFSSRDPATNELVVVNQTDAGLSYTAQAVLYFAYDDPHLLPAAREDDDDNAEHDFDNDDVGFLGGPADPQASSSSSTGAGGTKAALSEFVALRYYNFTTDKSPMNHWFPSDPANASALIKPRVLQKKLVIERVETIYRKIRALPCYNGSSANPAALAANGAVLLSPMLFSNH